MAQDTDSMAASNDEPPSLRCKSPSPETTPSRAVGACPELIRCLSTASSVSHGSGTTEASNMRESLGSDLSANSRQSSASFQSYRRSDVSGAFPARYSTGTFDGQGRQSIGGGRRRGYMRPQATDFAASAKQRESVLSLGSIAHLQHYFARTGLLDGKGAQFARKRQLKAQTLDLSSLESSSYLMPQIVGSDVDSSYASLGSSPDLAAQSLTGHATVSDAIVESPIEDNPEEEYYLDDYDEADSSILPPTTSTYHVRHQSLPKPPSIQALKRELTATLDDATKALDEITAAQVSATTNASEATALTTGAEVPAVSPGWYEIQGMHILDVMTLAIRAAKVYYTSHEQPDRLDAIKSEKEVRSDLLAVMDVLKRMAARGFAGGLRQEEISAMADWISGVLSLLRREQEMESAESAERASWVWLQEDGWDGRETEREHAFLQSLVRSVSQSNLEGVATEDQLPTWTPIDRKTPLEEQALPSTFLKHLRNGVLLVQLHNAAVRKSKRRFGAIPTYYTDTKKPYRSADNLRYWAKAAELRWEAMLKIDALGIVYDSRPQVWLDFEDAILKWCKKVREELSQELQA